jgi:hypothetical protein|tara:strand:+ start:653 stop:850 length:198 start_codon:yes stop_codon:yes gene_type:complete
MVREYLMAEFTSIAFDEIVELSLTTPMTEKILKQIINLSKEIIVDEEIKVAWVMEGVMLKLNEIK